MWPRPALERGSQATSDTRSRPAAFASRGVSSVRNSASLAVATSNRRRGFAPRLASGEREYLITHWPLLSGLRHALRTEHGVRLAVLYGSLARGGVEASSDLDLLVSLEGDRPSLAKLAVRLVALFVARSIRTG
jgi:predicted nucleotidyltransferase